MTLSTCSIFTQFCCCHFILLFLFLFLYDQLHLIKLTLLYCEQSRLRDVSIPLPLDKSDDQKSDCVPEFCIDAGSSGNISRFINHSCQPNLFVQCVLSSHHDIKQARIVLFAADNIPPLKVLSSLSLSVLWCVYVPPRACMCVPAVFST